MLVTVKPKFQVTIPAKLRERVDLREGDLMEASVVEGGIFFHPKAVVDRNAVADKIEEIFARIKLSPEDAARSEEEIMEDAIKVIVEARKERRDAKREGRS